MKNERSLSSASATRYCDLPRRAFDPMASTRPPTTTVGSSPPAASTAATMEVVVVLPCMPAMAMPYFRRISSASISARWMTGMCSSCASATSGFSVRDRGTGHDDFGACDVFRAMAFKRSSRPELASRWVTAECLQIRAGNFVAEIQQHLGDTAHADAADAYEMDALNFGEHKVNFLATDLRGSTRINNARTP